MHTTDYALIAAAIAEAGTGPFARSPSLLYLDGYSDCRRRVAECLADALAADNPRFAREKFLAACRLAPLTSAGSRR